MGRIVVNRARFPHKLGIPLAGALPAQGVNLEHFADGMTTDSPAIVAMANERLDILRTEAYRGSESLTLMEEMAEKWTP